MSMIKKSAQQNHDVSARGESIIYGYAEGFCPSRTGRYFAYVSSLAVAFEDCRAVPGNHRSQVADFSWPA